MTRPEQDNQKDRALLESRLAYHLRCLREDATDQALTSLERLALVRGRADRIRHIRQGTEGRKVVMGDVMGDVHGGRRF